MTTLTIAQFMLIFLPLPSKLCNTWHCLFVLATSHKNYWLELHANFTTKDVIFAQERHHHILEVAHFRITKFQTLKHFNLAKLLLFKITNSHNSWSEAIYIALTMLLTVIQYISKAYVFQYRKTGHFSTIWPWWMSALSEYWLVLNICCVKYCF